VKVGYSATLWDNSRSGIGIYIAEQLEQLSRRNDVDTSVIEYGGTILKNGATLDHRNGTNGTRQRLRPLQDILWHRNGLGQLAAREKFDVVHTPSIRRLPGKLPCPAVVTVHDLGPLRLAKKYGMLRQLYHQRLVPRWLRPMDAIATPSQSTKDDLVEIYRVDPARITVVPNGANHKIYYPGDLEASASVLSRTYGISRPFFVYVSRLEHPAKNHLRLIEAFALFKKKYRLPHRLVFVGAAWNGHELIKEAAKPWEEQGEIIITDFVPKEDLPHFLRAAAALIYPSLYEGFGLPVIEAMACGTPVACSRSSSLTEIAEGHALLFDPNSAGEICEAMQKLATDDSLRARLRADGIDHAQTFTWARSVSETIAVWRRALGGKS
jgi:glycosyltransferase involved in cell wall biosynthesis